MKDIHIAGTGINGKPKLTVQTKPDQVVHCGEHLASESRPHVRGLSTVYYQFS